ncbi:MAG: hypothetical protein E7317_10560 [Clostridiales bacterium]|nr:hypothetical protein [Clostridiales bacterium]
MANGKKAAKRRRAASRKRGKKLLTVFAVVLMPPLGIWLAWKKSRFSAASCVALTAAAVVLMCAYVAVIPGTTATPKGGVEFVRRKPQAEIYGPELPEDMVAGYQAPGSVENVLSSATEEPEIHVYINDDDIYFHTANCKRRYGTSSEITPYVAYYLGYLPCEICDPPTYAPEP